MSGSSEYNKRRKEKLKSAGLCTYCGKNPLLTVTLCAACRDKYVVRRQRSQRSDRLSRGVCGQCGKRPLLTKTQCASCRDKHKVYNSTSVSKYKSSGICVRCRKVPSAVDKNQCQSCLGKTNAKRKEVKDRVYSAYGGYRCRCCGETEPAFLTIDHVEDNGSFMRKNVHGEGSYSLYLWLAKNDYPRGFQILCMNCQWGKKTYGVCPHQAAKIES